MAIQSQTVRPDVVIIIDNSPEPLMLPLAESALAVHYHHTPSNIGTAGAINQSISWATESGAKSETSKPPRAEYLWLLDQDSEPGPELLGGLIACHQRLGKTTSTPVGIVAPLTRNRDDGQPNRPLRFDRFRSRAVLYNAEPVTCDFLPASGMLLHLPSLHQPLNPLKPSQALARAVGTTTGIYIAPEIIKPIQPGTVNPFTPPSADYFLDIYDFALGLAVKAAGAGVWLVPTLELSHQVGRKETFIKSGQKRTFADMPVSRVNLLHRNSTYLYTRSARGFYKVLAAVWQGRRALLQAWRFIHYGFDEPWAKAAAALGGWARGLYGLKVKRLEH